MVPLALRRQVWLTYRAGQCDDMKPSRAYADAARAAVIAVAEKEHTMQSSNPAAHVPIEAGYGEMKLTVTLNQAELGHLVMTMHAQEDKGAAWLRLQDSLAQRFAHALARADALPTRPADLDPTVARFGIIGTRLPDAPSAADGT